MLAATMFTTQSISQNQWDDAMLAQTIDGIGLNTNPPMGLLQVPLEIRQQIYCYAVPVCRLAPFPYSDFDWLFHTNEYRGRPPILSACRKIHEEVIPIFYTRAILEVAPPQLRPF